jgi:mannosyltransferase
MANAIKNRWVVCLGLVLVAGILRFHKLGDWPFANDELATIAEEKALYEGAPLAPESQTYRLPRIVPLSYFLHHVSNRFFGRDEWGSRVVMALFGTLCVGMTFTLLDVLKGRPAAIACGLLMALWPEHIFQSQQARFYIVVSFFAGLAMLLGAVAAERRTTTAAILTCLAVVATILCHPVIGIVFAIIFLGILAGSYAERRPLPKNVVLVFLATGILLGIYGLVYLKPLMSGWNSDATWGYGVVHSLLASVNAIGWPVALLAALGMLLLARERSAQNWYWVTCALGWAAASAILPRLVAYHPGYVFPLASSAVVLAGCAIGIVHDGLRSRGGFIAAAWIGLACLGNLPSLASHYKDGSRDDLRSAARFVEKNWRSGDRVTGFAMTGFGHYAEGCQPAIPLTSDPLRQLQELVADKRRLWIVLQSCRGGLPPELDRYLGTHCSHEFRVRRGRFDYAEYCVDVFLYTPNRER